jgi:hypothetical protein
LKNKRHVKKINEFLKDSKLCDLLLGLSPIEIRKNLWRFENFWTQVWKSKNSIDHEWSIEKIVYMKSSNSNRTNRANWKKKTL